MHHVRAKCEFDMPHTSVSQQVCGVVGGQFIFLPL